MDEKSTGNITSEELWRDLRNTVAIEKQLQFKAIGELEVREILAWKAYPYL